LIVRECRYITGATLKSQFPPAGHPEVVFLGRSNVGKSSLINLLVGRRIARVSRTPGRTQQAHFYDINSHVVLVDLPGYGYARAPARVREELIETIDAYLTAGRPIAMATLIVDSRHPPTELDQKMNEWLGSRGLRVQVVNTKTDKLPRSERNASMERSRRTLGLEDVMAFSSRTGEGKRELWAAIESRIADMRR